MLKTDLIDIVNEKKAWAFIGTGPSIDSGLPSWEKLIEIVIEKCNSEIKLKIQSDSSLNKSIRGKIYPRCFSQLETIIGRESLRSIVKEVLRVGSANGELIKLICDWPFAGIITTNYDNLIETTLKQAGQRDWVPVGNTEKEVLKISGDVTNVIWHIHGSVELPDAQSRLIITENDYDDIYLQRSPHIINMLQALLSQHRLIFIGFGFNDVEVKRTLRATGKFLNPARPAYAFISDIGGRDREFERNELRDKSNIEVIPYAIVNGSHKKLIDILKVHGSMVLRKSLELGKPSRECPSYHPETTGLLIYNNLCLKGEARVSDNILSMLLRSQILSSIQYQGSDKIDNIINELIARIKAIHGAAISGEEAIRSKIINVLKELSELGFIEMKEENVVFTEKGRELAATQAAKSDLLSTQFSNSLKQRALTFIADEKRATKVGTAAESFIKECVNRRALGVAMARFATSPDHHSYHMVALLQTLPNFISQLEDADEALALVKIIQNVLASPSESEGRYIGLALQAKFGVHLLSQDPDAVQARALDFSGTLFLIDSTTLISFLAKSSVGYDSAKLLIDNMMFLCSFVATTSSLAVEVAEHASWAFHNSGSDKGKLGLETYKSLIGYAGSRTNDFLAGFAKEVSFGKALPDFNEYMSSVLGVSVNGNVSIKDIKSALEKNSIFCLEFSEIEGFHDNLYVESELLQKEITTRRLEHNTYKHPRQVKAEAEALLIIKNYRNKVLKLSKLDIKNAYFISHTRIIDDIEKSPGAPITIRPEVALQWIMTLKPCSMNELSFLTNNLLAELSEANDNIVDIKQLSLVFSPLINASEKQLQDALSHHGALVATRYGESAENAFKTVASMDAPIVFNGLESQVLAQMEEKVRKLLAEKAISDKRAELTDKEKRDLIRLKTKKEERAKKALAGKRKKKKKR